MLRNGPDGYGWLTKALHWATVLTVALQFTVGYVLDLDGDSGRGRGRGRGGDSGRGRGRGGEDGGYDLLDDRLALVHVGLGALIVLLVLARIAWRRIGSLPPWAVQLSARQRRLATWTERSLLAVLLAIPVTGVVLVLSGDDDLVWLHVGAHVVFFGALASHLTTNLRPAVLRRMV